MPRMPGTQLAPRSRMKLPIPRERNIIGLKPCLRTHTRAQYTDRKRGRDVRAKSIYPSFTGAANHLRFERQLFIFRCLASCEPALRRKNQRWRCSNLAFNGSCLVLEDLLVRMAPQRFDKFSWGISERGSNSMRRPDMFEIPEWKPAALRRVRPRGLVDLSHAVTCPLGTYRSLFARLTVVKSRRSDPPEITLMFPFFGSFIGPARDKRVRRVAVWPPMDDPMGRSCDKHYARQRCACLSIRSARRTISRCRVISRLVSREKYVVNLFIFVIFFHQISQETKYSIFLAIIVAFNSAPALVLRLALFHFPVYAMRAVTRCLSLREFLLRLDNYELQKRSCKYCICGGVRCFEVKLGTQRCWAAAVFGIASERDAAPVIKAT